MTHTITLSTWYIGIFMAIIGCLVDASGWMIEKKSHITLKHLYAKQNKEESIRYLCYCRWWCGFTIHTLGTIIFAISLGFGKQSLITPLASFALLFNAILAYKFLNEKFTKTQMIGTLIIVIGCSLAIAFGPRHNEKIYNAKELTYFFGNISFSIFAITISFIFITNYIIYKFHFITSEIYSMFSAVGFSAFFGSWSALFQKCFIQIIGTCANGVSDNWLHWLTYISVIMIICNAILLEYWRQEALKNYPANYVSSIYNSIFIIQGILFGAFFFNEFEDMNVVSVALFILGILISFAGVGMLTFKPVSIIKQAYVELGIVNAMPSENSK
eukprot:343987_1